MKVQELLNEFLDSNKSRKDDRESLADLIWAKFEDGIGMYPDKAFDLDGVKVHIFWNYNKTGKPKAFYKKSMNTIFVKIDMNTIPVHKSEWNLLGFESKFRDIIGPAINDYYNEN